MGMRMPETCWAVFKRQVISLRSCCILLVDSVERNRPVCFMCAFCNGCCSRRPSGTSWCHGIEYQTTVRTCRDLKVVVCRLQSHETPRSKLSEIWQRFELCTSCPERHSIVFMALNVTCQYVEHSSVEFVQGECESSPQMVCLFVWSLLGCQSCSAWLASTGLPRCRTVVVDTKLEQLLVVIRARKVTDVGRAWRRNSGGRINQIIQVRNTFMHSRAELRVYDHTRFIDRII